MREPLSDRATAVLVVILLIDLIYCLYHLARPPRRLPPEDT